MKLAPLCSSHRGAERIATYTYDTNGNITQIRDGNNVIQYQYTYDALGQLIREDNRALNRTYVFTYDDAGNIDRKDEYSFTTGEPENLIDQQLYYYNDDISWDRLTKYDDQTITYDQIGNPTRIGEYDMFDER